MCVDTDSRGVRNRHVVRIRYIACNAWNIPSRLENIFCASAVVFATIGYPIRLSRKIESCKAALWQVRKGPRMQKLRRSQSPSNLYKTYLAPNESDLCKSSTNRMRMRRT